MHAHNESKEKKKHILSNRPQSFSIRLEQMLTRQFSSSIPSFKRLTENAFSLNEWLFRKELFKLYRRIVRTAYKTHERRELIEFAKGQFIQNKEVAELNQRKYLLNVGMKQFRDMSKTMGFSLDVGLKPSDL
ncbi:hypothetical protein CLIB1423_06S05974 [[Candida] railenensis]|uniref:Uncharacterized protein n=1 Tax=[Candida] railenensis TaxID=45579 RepID=A0A9P0VYC0_9ASCO|nr:hypothetical protein CLIB1423_06S05974 [[Candida] railenensis]